MAHIKQWKEISKIAIIATGTSLFIPQKIYQPYTEADRVRYIKDADLKPPVYFYSKDPYECAVSLDDALKARLKNLIDKEEQMFTGCGPSIFTSQFLSTDQRVQWPGYRPWTKQIPTYDFKTPRGPITKGKLAKNIANCVRSFIEVAEKQHMEAESDRRWKVGRRHIKVEDLMLVSLHHVSKGSWQPQLRLRRALPEYSAHRSWSGAVASSSGS
ncbi:hypothetical protein F5I97DRAFT_1798867 [Phlebopus sp. FC_14]|nr:hypothetical protein F5I97DRAFT_1798867 [Phlebopus sp. FC_14]